MTHARDIAGWLGDFLRDPDNVIDPEDRLAIEQAIVELARLERRVAELQKPEDATAEQRFVVIVGGVEHEARLLGADFGVMAPGVIVGGMSEHSFTVSDVFFDECREPVRETERPRVPDRITGFQHSRRHIRKKGKG